MLTSFSGKLTLVQLLIVTREFLLLLKLALRSQKKILFSLITHGKNFLYHLLPLRYLFVYSSKGYLILRTSINGHYFYLLHK